MAQRTGVVVLSKNYTFVALAENNTCATVPAILSEGEANTHTENMKETQSDERASLVVFFVVHFS